VVNIKNTVGKTTKFVIELVNIVGIVGIMVKHRRQEWIVDTLIQRVLDISLLNNSIQ
jgi:hypothetical protein